MEHKMKKVSFQEIYDKLKEIPPPKKEFVIYGGPRFHKAANEWMIKKLQHDNPKFILHTGGIPIGFN